MSEQKLNYDYAICRDLSKNTRDNFKEARDYYFKHVISVDGGLTYYFKDGKLVSYPTDKFKTEKMRGFDAKFKKAIEEHVYDYTEVLETEDYVVDHEKRKVNTLGRVYAKTLDKVKVTDKGKNYVEFVKKFLFEIISRRDKCYYEFLLKYISNILRLKKNDVMLSFITKSQGVGKSSVGELIMAMLGEDLCLRANHEDLGSNNLICYGKVYILIEELGGLSDLQYNSLIENLKNMITASTKTFKDKYIRGKQLPVISNIMVTSNHNVSLGGDARREINKMISTAWEGKAELWAQLYDFCDENIKALYDFFMTVNVDGFRAQVEAKKIKDDDDATNLKAVESMCDVWVMLKEEYALSKKSTKVKQSDLYDQYKEKIFPKKPLKLSKFDELVMELECTEKRTSTGNLMYYFIDGNALYEKFKLKNMIMKHELTEKSAEHDKEVNLAKENAELKNKIAELERLLQEQSKTNKVVEKTQTKIIENTKKQDEKTHSQIKKSDDGVKIIKVQAFRKI
jgi:hypothetical protein